MGFALKQAQRILSCIDQRPVESQELPARTPREYEVSHRLLFRRPPLRQLAAELIELNRLATLQLIDARL